MSTADSASAPAGGRSADHEFWVGLSRAFGGALFFSLPLLMTMEMWWLGFYMDRVRLALLMILFFPLLVGLDYFSGFKGTSSSWGEDVVDALVAYAVGFTASAVILYLMGVIVIGTPLREVVGMVALQAVPASLGAVLANSQLKGGEGKKSEEERKERAGYGGELLFLTTGALFLAFNLAPTEEMILIAFKMTPWHALALAVATLLMMHAFVYSVGFEGAPSTPENTSGWSLFLRFTVVGYAIAIVVSAYVLWTFGRYEESSYPLYVMEALVLGFPAGLGAAAARIIL